MVGMHAARYTNLLLEECDLLIALGVRFDDRATGKAAAFCPRAKILHVDIDASELGKIKQPLLGIEADVGEIAARAAGTHRGHATPRMACSTWTRLRDAYPLAMPGADDPLAPYGIVRHVAALAGDDAIVTSDVGQHQMWVAQAFPFARPRQWLTSGGLGTMGFGLPAAIGAALAEPERTVVCFTGDGSLLMNLQELATAAEEDVNVKVILLNNGHLGLGSPAAAALLRAATARRASTPSPTSPPSRAASASPRTTSTTPPTRSPRWPAACASPDRASSTCRSPPRPTSTQWFRPAPPTAT